MQIPYKFQFWGSDLSNELHILKNDQNRRRRILGINFSNWITIFFWDTLMSIKEVEIQNFKNCSSESIVGKQGDRAFYT